MDMEEDAMLVAIGFMDIDEARDKWADKWADFCKSLTKWKSVHQLLRIARLNQLVAELSKIRSIFNYAIKGLSLIKSQIYQIIKTGASDVWPWPKKIDSRLAIKKINQVVDAARDMYKMGTLSKADERFIFGRDGLQGVGNELEKFGKLESETKGALRSSKIQLMKHQDEIDITKPYAMGLLVADIFYSLSAAIEGDIY